jgi:tetratricopeptide (TPR) repeat protein
MHSMCRPPLFYEMVCTNRLEPSLLYAYGNLRLAQGNVDDAQKDYKRGFDLSHELGPTHPLTAAFLYKLGLVDSRKHEYKQAM